MMSLEEMAAVSKIKVILAEDEQVLRQSLVGALSVHEDIEVVGEASNGEEALALCQRMSPDVAVLDIRMPVMNGIEAARRIRMALPTVRLLILTTFDDDEYLRQLFGMGVDGYLLKTDDTLPLAEAIRSVYLGTGAVDKGVSLKLGYLLNQPTAKQQSSSLSEMELRVARLIEQGKYNKDIASELDISYGRARNIVSAVYRKLGAIDRDDLVSILRRSSLS